MMVGVGGDDHGDDGVGVGRAVTRVYMLDAAETSYSSPGGKISNVRGRSGIRATCDRTELESVTVNRRETTKK